MEQDATDKLLAAIEGVDKKFDRHNQANDQRFLRIEDELGEHRAAITERREPLATHTLTTIASTAARAVEHALAKQDETLEPALSIVKMTIAHKGLRVFLLVCAGVGAMGGCADRRSQGRVPRRRSHGRRLQATMP